MSRGHFCARSLGVYLPETGKHNVLYNRATKSVTLVDFESLGNSSGMEHELDAPELLAIFGS